MRCPKCRGKSLEDVDEEYVCEKCGAAFGLEYLGWYPDGAGPEDRIDEGFEEDIPQEIKDMWKKAEEDKK